MRSPLVICFLLFAVTLGVYWPVQRHDFIYYDDPQFITENEQVKAGLTAAGFVYAFTQPVVGNWHPITTLSHMLDCELFGVNPGAHHLANAVLHAFNAVLLFLVLRQMTGRLWASAAVAVLFALHPLRVESVAWVSERKDVLCWFFGLFALLAYQRYVTGAPQKRCAWWRSPAYWLAVACFALSLMSKAMLVTFPFLLLLLDVWPLQRVPSLASLAKPSVSRSLWIEKLPFLLLSAGLSLITLRVQAAAGAMTFLAPVSGSDRLANAISSYWKYLAKWIWPTDLAVVYPHSSAPYAAADRWPVWAVLLAGLALLGVSIIVLRQFARRPYLAIGWFWFLGTLIPVIGLVQVGEQAMADRYTYIPLVGLALALVWLVADWVRAARISPRLVVIGFTGCVVALLLVTHRQIGYWRNTVTLFDHTLRVTRANPSAHFALGVGLEKTDQISAAIAQYHTAIKLHPKYKKAHYNLGQYYRKSGQWAEAAAAYRAVLAIDPEDQASRLNLASVLNQLGQNQEAITEFNAVLARDPDSFEALNNLAWILATTPEAELRDGARAVALATKACSLTEHRLPIFLGTLAAAYAEAGRFPDAITTAERAIELATAAGQPEIAARNRELLELYRSGRPYHEPAPML